MDWIETYINNLQIICNMSLDDYGDKKKLKNNNKLADMNRQIAKDIENKYPEMKIEFAKLLQDDNWRVRSQVAHHMLEVINYPQEYRKAALDEIKSVIKRDIAVESLGNRMWLEQWYEQHPQDMQL